MPAQAVAALSPLGYGVCSSCKELEDLYHLCVAVTNGPAWTSNEARMCISCLCKQQATRVDIKPTDVISTKSQRRIINKMARKRERACAKEIGGKTTPASGAGIAKGDARSDRLMVDDKFTKGGSYIVKETTMLRTVTEARRTGRMGVLKVGFVKEGSARTFNAAVLDWDDFMELIHGQG